MVNKGSEKKIRTKKSKLIKGQIQRTVARKEEEVGVRAIPTAGAGSGLEIPYLSLLLSTRR